VERRIHLLKSIGQIGKHVRVAACFHRQIRIRTRRGVEKLSSDSGCRQRDSDATGIGEIGRYGLGAIDCPTIEYAKACANALVATLCPSGCPTAMRGDQW
jgi:hypothetical protein